MYDTNTQLLYLSVFLAQPDLYSKMLRVHKPLHYNPTIRKAVDFIDEYYSEYSSLPDHLMIQAKTGVEVPRITEVDHGIESWFMTEYPKFSLHKSLENALYKADEEVQSQNYDAMEKIISEAYDVRLGFDYGISYAEDPAGRLQNILDRSGNISYGFQGLDGTVGKMNRGDLVIYVGPSGAGKSLFLQNHSVNHWKNGLNVLQVTLELHPELVSRRMDCMFMNKSISDLYADLGNTALEFSTEMKKHNVGEMQVKYMPSGSKTSEIKNLVKMYMNDTKKQVDILVVDYLDLVDPAGKFSIGDTFNKDKLVSEELRNIGQELGCIIITASQINRSGVGLDELDHSNIAGGISKINTADLVLGIITNNAMRENGEYELQVLKTRNSGGTGRKIPMRINPHSMRISDDPEYISKIGKYLKMSTEDANKDRTQTEASKAFAQISSVLAQSNKPAETAGTTYGNSFENGLGSAETLPGDQEDDRFRDIRNLINKSTK